MSRNVPVPVMVLLEALRDRGDEWNSNRHALEVTLEELAQQDRFRPVDAAQIQACRLLAAAVDADCTNAALWAQYRQTLDGLVTDGSSRDDFAELLAHLQSPVRDSSEA
jgi:hypothetical protein